jgi:hypothetical protein
MVGQHAKKDVSLHAPLALDQSCNALKEASRASDSQPTQGREFALQVMANPMRKARMFLIFVRRFRRRECLLRRSYLVPMPSQWDRLAQVHTEFTRSGDLLVPCHKYCGLGHSEMWATVQVLPQDEFKPDRDGRVSCAQR